MFLQIVKDWHLTLIVVALCLVVVIIGVTVAIWGQYEAVQVPDFERPESRNVSARATIRHMHYSYIALSPDPFFSQLFSTYVAIIILYETII